MQTSPKSHNPSAFLQRENVFLHGGGNLYGIGLICSSIQSSLMATRTSTPVWDWNKHSVFRRSVLQGLASRQSSQTQPQDGTCLLAILYCQEYIMSMRVSKDGQRRLYFFYFLFSLSCRSKVPFF